MTRSAAGSRPRPGRRRRPPPSAAARSSDDPRIRHPRPHAPSPTPVSASRRAAACWSRRAGSNRRPAAYKAAALPAELRRRRARTARPVYRTARSGLEPALATRPSGLYSAHGAPGLQRATWPPREAGSSPPSWRRLVAVGQSRCAWAWPSRPRQASRGPAAAAGLAVAGAAVQRLVGGRHGPRQRRHRVRQGAPPPPAHRLADQDHDGHARARAGAGPRAGTSRCRPPPWASTAPASASTPGDRIKMRQLLLGLMVRSATDCAVTLATAIAGDEPAFVRLMNRRAAQLGLDGHALRQLHRPQRPRPLLLRPRPLRARARGHARPTLPQPRRARVGARHVAAVARGLHRLPQPLQRAVRLGRRHQDRARPTAPAPAWWRAASTAAAGSSSPRCTSPTATQEVRDALRLFAYGASRFARSVVVRRGERVGEISVAGGTVPLVAADDLTRVVRRGATVKRRVQAPGTLATRPPTRWSATHGSGQTASCSGRCPSAPPRRPDAARPLPRQRRGPCAARRGLCGDLAGPTRAHTGCSRRAEPGGAGANVRDEYATEALTRKRGSGGDMDPRLRSCGLGPGDSRVGGRRPLRPSGLGPPGAGVDQEEDRRYQRLVAGSGLLGDGKRSQGRPYGGHAKELLTTCCAL